jgi:hypothetical protein
MFVAEGCFIALPQRRPSPLKSVLPVSPRRTAHLTSLPSSPAHSTSNHAQLVRVFVEEFDLDVEVRF